MIEAPETPHVPHVSAHAPRRWLDLALAVAVIIVSAASLLVSMHTSHTMEALVEQNARLVRANSLPLLQLDSSNVDDQNKPVISLELDNVGAGPARIVWLEVRRNGRAYGSMSEFLSELKAGLPPPQPPGEGQPADISTTVTSTTSPTILPAGRSITVLRFDRPETPRALALWRAADNARWSLEAEACFCSVFDECWTSSLDGAMPKPVNACSVEGRTPLKG